MTNTPSKLATFIPVMILLAACGGGGSADVDGGGGDGDPDLVGTWTGYETGDTVTVWTFDLSSTSLGAATGGTEVYTGTYAVDTNAAPHHITILITDSSITSYVGETSNGIYELTGNQLTFAANAPGDTRRPTDFNGGNGARVWDLTRQ